MGLSAGPTNCVGIFSSDGVGIFPFGGGIGFWWQWIVGLVDDVFGGEKRSTAVVVIGSSEHGGDQTAGACSGDEGD
ncbi:unnamed protein product [Linum trigynum]|uniref:Uncharacterized protein n=1 Tax=Linum trigynum TaxID=586398 RepID=A0AAV2DZI9_9ROSI